MKLPDTNVLIHAVNPDAAQHKVAAIWLAQAFDSPSGVALLGFVHITTRSGILPRPLSVTQALQAVNHWLAQPTAQIIQPGERHAPLLGRLLLGAGTAGNLTNDAHLAAPAIEHGATLGSFDRDFERFAGLRFELLKA